MSTGRQTGSAHAGRRAALAACAALLACQLPAVGDPVTATAAPGPAIELENAQVGVHGHVVATFTVSDDDVPLARAEVEALEPRFTLAKLTDHPADGLRAWESLLPTGRQVAAKVPPGGPDDPEVLTSVRQPGSEHPAALEDLGEGRYQYVFASPVTGFDPDETLRVGVWLEGAERATVRTSATFDFQPSGGLAESRDAVLDENCTACHGTVVAHERMTGVRLCLTCHTWQNTDPDTLDPAALWTTATTTKTNPNPLELGRMVHRIHRGKDLPSIYQSSWDPAGASTVPSAVPLPPPFIINRPGVPPASARTVIAGRKFSIVDEHGRENVYARARSVATADPVIGTMLLAEGGMHPRDLRDCEVCHRGAPQGWMVTYAMSRRTCSGCHPEIWYQASAPAVDRSRFPHPGGPQADDARCLGCHVTGTPKLYAPVVEAHVPPARAPRYNQPVVEIRRVEELEPGKRPKVTFTVHDRVGPLAPQPGAPDPAYEPDGPTSSYVPRKLTALVLKIIGPTTPDYSALKSVQLVSGTGGNPDPLGLSTTGGTDTYVYTFATAIPEGTTGTFAVGAEARRSVTLSHYDPATDTFRWPYTGEAVNETAENVIVYVDSAVGIWPPPEGKPPPVPRRTVVSLAKCLRCHDRIEFHGGQKHDVAWCVTCHTPDETDWDKRPKQWTGGPVNLGATYDGVEERSTHYKTMMHRIHTSGRRGVASLEGIAPYLTYYSKAYFFDRGGYPGDLANCTLCHEGKTYLIESMPSDAPPTTANEQPTIWHAGNPFAHAAGEPSVPPIQAACLGCHATGASFAHAARHTVSGEETCAKCHEKGAYAVEVAHGLAPPGKAAASGTFSSIAQELLVPRCATSACHAGDAAEFPRLDADFAYDALVGVASRQDTSQALVEPGAPERSYLLPKLRGDPGIEGQPMPPGEALLDPADLAAIEAWIANGAPND